MRSPVRPNTRRTWRDAGARRWPAIYAMPTIREIAGWTGPPVLLATGIIVGVCAASLVGLLT